MAADSEVDKTTTPEQKEAEKFREDFADLMRHPEFRRVLWYLIEEVCNTHGSPASAAASNLRSDADGMTRALETQRVIGQQEVGIRLRLYAQTLEPKLYQSMLKEALDLRIQRAVMSPNPPQQ